MDTNSPTQHTPPASNIPDPVGPDNFTLQTMRDIATRYGATSFVDRQATDASDVGFLVNPRDSQMQFGLATYTLENDISFTHSLAAFRPHEAAQHSVPVDPHDPMSAHQAYKPTTYYYLNVIDIALPYRVPHVLTFSRLNQGLLSSLMSSDKPYFDKSVASRIELEGDFSQYVDTYAPPGEDVNAFTYLAPNIMELVLRRASEFSIEFIDSHIYITFRHQKAATIRPPANTTVSARLHENTLQLGFEVSQALVRASRPLGQQSQPTAQIPRPDAFSTILHSVLPVLILLLAPGTVWVVGMMIVMFTQFTVYGFLATFILPILIASLCLGTLIKRYTRESRRYRAYKQRYTTALSTETLSPAA